MKNIPQIKLWLVIFHLFTRPINVVLLRKFLVNLLCLVQKVTCTSVIHCLKTDYLKNITNTQ